MTLSNCTQNVQLDEGINNKCTWCLIFLFVPNVIGLFINSFVLINFIRIKASLKAAQQFLVCLIVGQLMLTVLVGPLRIINILYSREHDQGYCILQFVIRYVDALAIPCAVSNGVISFDRYLHAALAHNYRSKMKGFPFYCLLLLPWMSSFMYLLSAMFGELVNYAIALIFVLSLYITMVVNYVRLIRILNEQQRRTSQGKLKNAPNNHRNIKAVTLCLCILLVELVSSLPALLMLIFGICSKIFESAKLVWNENNALLKDISLSFFLFGACVNPLVYLYSNREFKRTIRRSMRTNRVSWAGTRLPQLHNNVLNSDVDVATKIVNVSNNNGGDTMSMTNSTEMLENKNNRVSLPSLNESIDSFY